MPDDLTCPWNNGGNVPEGEYAGGTMYYSTPITVCSSIAIDIVNLPGTGTGGEPTVGGEGGETSPYPPENYNPCEPGLPCTELSGLSTAEIFANEIGLTDFSLIDFLRQPANVQLLGTLKNYLIVYGSSAENKEFLKWTVGYFMNDPYISLGLLGNIYDVVRYQNTTPRDREPASYNWRTKLTTDDFSNYLSETTPMWININGTYVRNIEAYNCHYYAFGPAYATVTLENYPKWIMEMQLTSKNWNQVTGNVQIGDRVTYYYKNQNDDPFWTHSAIVTEVDADGYATEVSSKMGTYQILKHHPRDIPSIYGIPAPTFEANAKTPTGKATYPSRIYWRKK
jgi:hypothetical protein